MKLDDAIQQYLRHLQANGCSPHTIRSYRFDLSALCRFLGAKGADVASIKKHFTVIFEHELWGWCTDPEQWPTDRTYSAFRKWFEVEFHSMILELGDGDVEVEWGLRGKAIKNGAFSIVWGGSGMCLYRRKHETITTGAYRAIPGHDSGVKRLDFLVRAGWSWVAGP